MIVFRERPSSLRDDGRESALHRVAGRKFEGWTRSLSLDGAPARRRLPDGPKVAAGRSYGAAGRPTGWDPTGAWFGPISR